MDDRMVRAEDDGSRRARARSTHLGIGDDVLRNVGRALAQAHALTHGERFGFGFGFAIDRMRRDVSTRV